MTGLKPIIAPVKGVKTSQGLEIFDAFEAVGEPIGQRAMCQNGITQLFGEVPPYLEPVRIELTGTILKKPKRNEKSP